MLLLKYFIVESYFCNNFNEKIIIKKKVKKNNFILVTINDLFPNSKLFFPCSVSCRILKLFTKYGSLSKLTYAHLFYIIYKLQSRGLVSSTVYTNITSSLIQSLNSNQN